MRRMSSHELSEWMAYAKLEQDEGERRAMTRKAERGLAAQRARR